ncbi:MAG: glycosyltransferase family 4 protein [Candidatus Aenigmarchaeota archaeon]|nr:glycosyltransferase family 4 protein [Candidatus Aenigmarchaeota archaeon]
MIKMKIYILETNLPGEDVKSGGEERFTEGLSENLSRRHEVVVLTNGSKSSEKIGNLCIKRIGKMNVPVIKYVYRVLVLMRELLKTENIDIIQSNISDTSNGIAGAVIKKIRGTKLITRVSGFGDPKDIGVFKRLIYRFIFRNSDVIVAINSNFMVKDIKKLYNKSRVIVLPHGIDTEIRMKSKSYPRRKKFRLLFVGRLVYFKNVGMLLASFKLLREKFDVSLDIIGNGPEERMLRKTAEDLGIKDNVNFLGEVSNEIVIDYMDKAHIFTFPSKREPRGLVLIEAMRSGLPVVAVNRGGPKDIIKPGRNGFLVEPEDAAGFSESVSRLLKDRNLYERISSNNVKDVYIFSWENVTKVWENVYGSLLGKKYLSISL